MKNKPITVKCNGGQKKWCPLEKCEHRAPHKRQNDCGGEWCTMEDGIKKRKVRCVPYDMSKTRKLDKKWTIELEK